MIVALWGWWDVELTDSHRRRRFRPGQAVLLPRLLAGARPRAGSVLRRVSRGADPAGGAAAVRPALAVVCGRLAGLRVERAAGPGWSVSAGGSCSTCPRSGRPTRAVSARWPAPRRCSWAASSCRFATFRIGCSRWSLALPFASITQTPADLFVERVRGPDVLVPLIEQWCGLSCCSAAAQLATLLATRRVVIQGG